MSKLGSGNTPVTGGGESWTNELLPLGIRRELLERELQRFVANKRQVQAARPGQKAAEHRTGDHPLADDTTDSERAS
jgi:hypothetical protein